MSIMRHYEYFTGRIGQVRDLVELAEGNCVVNFSVAETPRIRKADGTWVDATTIWTDVSIFGDEARNLVRSVKPGTFVTVIGTRQAREYETKDTKEKRISQQIVAEQVAVAITKFNYIEGVGNVNYAKEGRGGGAPAGGQSQPQANTQAQPAQTTKDPFNSDPFDNSGGDDDPFGGNDDDPFSLGS